MQFRRLTGKKIPREGARKQTATVRGQCQGLVSSRGNCQGAYDAAQLRKERAYAVRTRSLRISLCCWITARQPSWVQPRHECRPLIPFFRTLQSDPTIFELLGFNMVAERLKCMQHFFARFPFVNLCAQLRFSKYFHNLFCIRCEKLDVVDRLHFKFYRFHVFILDYFVSKYKLIRGLVHSSQFTVPRTKTVRDRHR
jgi:hypothetical protein